MRFRFARGGFPVKESQSNLWLIWNFAPSFYLLLLISQVLKNVISSACDKLMAWLLPQASTLLSVPRSNRGVSPHCSVGAHSVPYLQGSQPWKSGEVLTQECGCCSWLIQQDSPQKTQLLKRWALEQHSPPGSPCVQMKTRSRIGAEGWYDLFRVPYVVWGWADNTIDIFVALHRFWDF